MRYEFEIKDNEAALASVIKSILNAMDMCDIPKHQKDSLRKIVLDNINDLYRRINGIHYR